jgi:hypothetical protein
MRRVIEDNAEGYLEQTLPEIANWLKPLLLVPEHTWGLDAKAWLGEHSKLGASELAVLRRSRRVRQMEESWQEQRAYIESAMDNAPFLKEAVNAKRASVVGGRGFQETRTNIGKAGNGNPEMRWGGS